MKINLALLNNSPFDVSYEIQSLSDLLGENSIDYGVTKSLERGALNIVIGNFNKKAVQQINEFCMETNGKIVVLMTEHIDFYQGQFVLHGKKLYEPHSYLSEVRRQRLLDLISLKPCIYCFFRIGDFPELNGLSASFTEIPVQKLNFAQIKLDSVTIKKLKKSIIWDYDCSFTGNLTNHRAKLLKEIKSRMKLSVNNETPPLDKGNSLSKSAKFVLDIPQHADSKWNSPMCIYMALKSNRPVISLSTQKLLGESGHIGLKAQNVEDLEMFIRQENWLEVLESQVRQFNAHQNRADYFANPSVILQQYKFLYN